MNINRIYPLTVKTTLSEAVRNVENRKVVLAERITIKSIAKDLGISHMTVSRALSNHPNVLQETREKVQQRAREMGYVKSAAAKAMRGDGTRIVGLLLPNIINEFYARFANALALACEAEALQLIIHLTSDDLRAESEALERLTEVQARGVVMVPAPGDAPERSEALRTLNVIHLIRQVQSDPPVPAILIDDHQAIVDAVSHLANEGHKNIAYIGADPALSSGRSRLSAFRAGLKVAGLDVNPEQIKTSAPSRMSGQEQMESLLQDGGATAVVCGGVELSNGALQALLTHNQLGNRVAFIGYGDAGLYAWVGNGVSAIDLPISDLAKAACDLLAKPPQDRPAEHLTFAAKLLHR